MRFELFWPHFIKKLAIHARRLFALRRTVLNVSTQQGRMRSRTWHFRCPNVELEDHFNFLINLIAMLFQENSSNTNVVQRRQRLKMRQIVGWISLHFPYIWRRKTPSRLNRAFLCLHKDMSLIDRMGNNLVCFRFIALTLSASCEIFFVACMRLHRHVIYDLFLLPA